MNTMSSFGPVNFENILTKYSCNIFVNKNIDMHVLIIKVSKNGWGYNNKNLKKEKISINR